VNPVRPPVLPVGSSPSQVQRPDAARQAAQRAFFQAALGHAPAAAAPVSAAQTAPVAAAPQRRPDPRAEAPAKILRPGSLLDIRV
jgi:hypothetical protein